MFAVIRHTFEIDVTNKYQSSGEWKHKIWLFKSENEAVTYAVSLLDNPVILANEHSLAHAIETLQTGKYWQYGRESIAIGKVEEPKIIEEKTDDEKSIH